MTVTWRELAYGALISWACTPAGAALAQPDCPVAVRATGDSQLVADVTAALAEAGVATEPVQPCAPVNVALEHQGEQLHLTITDTYGRTTERVVRDVATAATVIESWTQQEVAAFAEPELPVAAAARPAPAPAPIDRPTPSPVPARPYERAAVTGGFAALLGDDGHTRLGGVLGGCVRLGRVCVGVAGGVATGVHASIHTDGRDHERWLDGRATVELPVRVGPVVVSPGVAIGVGWLETTTSFAPHDVESLVHSSTAFHAGASLAVARALTSRLMARIAVAGAAGAWTDGGVAGPGAFGSVSLGLAVVVP